MSEHEDEVLQLVRAELEEHPDTPTRALYEKACKAHPSIRELTLRQFHGRYPLQVKRQLAAARKRSSGQLGRKPRTTSRRRRREIDREAVRRVLVTLAEDVAAAEGKLETIRLVADLDSYVDQVEMAASKAGAR